MSHLYTKIEYECGGAYGSTEKHLLYCHHNLSCDCITVFDERGDVILSSDEWSDKSLYKQIIRLLQNGGNEDVELGIELAKYDELKQIGIIR